VGPLWPASVQTEGEGTDELFAKLVGRVGVKRARDRLAVDTPCHDDRFMRGWVKVRFLRAASLAIALLIGASCGEKPDVQSPASPEVQIEGGDLCFATIAYWTDVEAAQFLDGVLSDSEYSRDMTVITDVDPPQDDSRPLPLNGVVSQLFGAKGNMLLPTGDETSSAKYPGFLNDAQEYCERTGGQAAVALADSLLEDVGSQIAFGGEADRVSVSSLLDGSNLPLETDPADNVGESAIPPPASSPQTAAQALFDAWQAGDLDAAQDVASDQALASLSETDPTGFRYNGVCEPGICSFDNESAGFAFYLVVTKESDGYSVSRADLAVIESGA
jgi:hypothetical protein